MTKMYRGESIRLKSADRSLPTFGKFGCVVRTAWVEVFQSDGDWCYHTAGDCGISGGTFDTADEARQVGEGTLRREGFAFINYSEAAKEAANLAAERHDAHKSRSLNYARHYA